MSDEPKPGQRVISRKDLAKLWGLSPNTIDWMRQSGMLKTVATGLFDLDHALTVRAAQDPSRGAISKLVNPRGKVPGNKQPAASAPEDPEYEDGDETMSEDAKAAEGLLAARSERVQAQADLSQLRLREASGEVVRADEVRLQAFEASTIMVSQLRNLARRYGPSLASRSAKDCATVLDAAVYEVAEELIRRLNGIVPEGVGLKLEDFWPQKPTGVPGAHVRR